MSDPSGEAIPAQVLIEEITKKAPLAWVRPVLARRRPGGLPSAQAVWFAWHEGTAYVLSESTGNVEQPLPGIEDASAALVSVRSKEQGGRLLTWVAEAATVAAGSDEWNAVVPLLLGNRLNLPDGEAAPTRWARECRLTRLTPTGQLTEAPGEMPRGSQAAPPPETPATTDTPLPFVVGTATTRRPRPRRARRRR